MSAEIATIARLSTRDVAPADRLSYWSSILSSTLTPVSVDSADPLEYESEMRALALPSITFVAQRGSAQRAVRAQPEIRRTTEHCFNLVLVFGGTWHVTHGTRNKYSRGDLIFYDSRYELDVDLLGNYDDLNLQLSEQFIRRWVPNPAWLIGRRMVVNSHWGRVLAGYLAQLSPEFVLQAPLPQSILIDQVGALLALTATELSGSRASSTRGERSMCERIQDHVRQRCTEATLQVGDIASSLNISTRTLHRALTSCGETFGAMLLRARVDVAARMLQSPLFDRISAAEIARRSGFSDASHFTKVLRRHTGQTPVQMRRARRI